VRKRVTLVDRDGAAEVVTRIEHDASRTARGVQGKHCLNADGADACRDAASTIGSKSRRRRPRASGPGRHHGPATYARSQRRQLCYSIDLECCALALWPGYL
jgi:hypothetical protein